MWVGSVLNLAHPESGTDLETFDNLILVVGNGQSRKDINLLKYTVPIIGCNALHRDITPNHLICCDRRMVEEATANNRLKNSKIYVRELWYHFFKKIRKNKNIEILPELPYQGEKKQDHPDHWGSGPYSLLIAAKSEYQTIYMIGFDLYSQNNNINNIYKGTNNYQKENDPPTDPSFWIYQIEKIFQIYKTKKFVIFNDDRWILPESWVKSNVEYRNIRLLDVDIK
jgi:hypothetical protein